MTETPKTNHDPEPLTVSPPHPPRRALMFKRNRRYLIKTLSRREEFWLSVVLGALSAAGITLAALVRSGVL